MSVYLETERLQLRQFQEQEAELLVELDSDPEVMRYLGPPFAERTAYEDRLRTFRAYYLAKHGLGAWAAIEKASGAFLGWFCLRPALDYRFHAEANFQADDAELGYRLRRAAWGKGYATEMARALVRRAFAELATPRVVAAALTTNLASLRVLEKAGLRRVGLFAVPGFEAPAAKYALTREEHLASGGQ